VRSLEKVFQQSLTHLKFSGNQARLNVQQDYLAAIAKIDAVRYIQEALPLKLHNDVARKILNADVLINSTPYKGEGQIVAVADTGFDRGSTTNTLPAFAGRVKKLYNLGRADEPGRTGKSDDPDGHGTHVCGSVLGDAVSDSMGGRIEAPASKATLVMQSTLDWENNLGGIPFNLEDLFITPYEDDGARVHVNSWGSRWSGSQAPYNAQSRSIDKFIWEHQDLVITFAAGNDAFDGDANGRVDPRTIGSQAAAKNCITVGATENARPGIKFTPPPWAPDVKTYTYGSYFRREYPAPPVSTDHMADKPQGIAAFSSRGPTLEGRIKPDVVAPGTAILSARSRAVQNAETFYGVSDDPAWYFVSGTSMANPLVGGCCAVLRETLVKNGVEQPSAALIKALLINGAEDILGQYSPSEATQAPNGDEGFGRVNLAASVIIPGAKHAGAGDEGPLNEGQEWSTKITVPEKRSELTVQAETATSKGRNAIVGLEREHGADPSAPLRLKVTLAYSDPPGAVLQNDLNLIVIGSRQERHGNATGRTFAVGSKQGFDSQNNVEQVVWDDVPAGTIEIKVRAARITKFAQPFAYAWKIF
jgi:hypothetical protein